MDVDPTALANDQIGGLAAHGDIHEPRAGLRPSFQHRMLPDQLQRISGGYTALGALQHLRP
jgi:hypothetical protein